MRRVVENFTDDARYALRQFRISPVFTATAVLTLALGIGGTTAIFSLMHAVMLRSLPVADPASLYRVGDSMECCMVGGEQGNWGLFSYPLFLRLKEAAPEFQELTAFISTTWPFSVRRQSTERFARPLQGEFVTGNYFATFGIHAFAGRMFAPADDQASSAPVAVLSYHLWRQAYGRDFSVVGSTFIVENHPFTVVGIAPPGFFGETLRSDPPDIWLPLQQESLINGQTSMLRQSNAAWLRIIGRLRSGATTDGLSARLSEVLRRWLINESGIPAVYIEAMKHGLPTQIIHIVAAGAGVAMMKNDYGRGLRILLFVCALVLVIACANVANLLLARAMARRAETSLRYAIGASRWRIISQSLIESVLLALGGGIAGLAIAEGAERFLLALAFRGAHFLPIDTRPSIPVLAFAFALSLLTGIVFGTAPAWFATRAEPADALRGTGRSTRDSSSFVRKALLVTQVTVSVVLVAGAGLLTRSLGNLEHQDFGFETHNRIVVSINPPPATYTQGQLQSLYRDLKDRLSHLPGVEQVALALYTPLTDNWSSAIVIPSRALPTSAENASWDRVDAGYFAAAGQTVLRGREFTEGDDDHSVPVAIVNQSFVRRFFPTEDALDKHFGIDLPKYAGTWRIVGVVRDAKYTDLSNSARPMFFIPLAQHEHYAEEGMQMVEVHSHFIYNLLLVSRATPGALEPLLRNTFAQLDPNLAITGVTTMQDQVEITFDQQRALASIAGILGILALVLAAVGLYGVTAYTIAQRTGEIAIRMAVGASRGSVIQLVLRGAFRRVMLGLLLGIPLAIGAGRLLSAELYDVRIWDPAALSVAVASLSLCALVAAIIPATRATAIAPMQALRAE